MNKSTYTQNRVIYFALGLDIRNANLSLEEANEIIQTMQTDPKFAYDFLIQKEGVAIKDEKILARSVAKVEKSGRLFSEKNKKDKKDKKMNKNNSENSISMNEILNHIIKNISKYTTAITLQNICENFNLETKRNVQFGRMSSVLAGLTRKGLLSRIGKGVYRPIENLVDQSNQSVVIEANNSNIQENNNLGAERKLLEDFIKKYNTTGEFIFTLSELRAEYPSACPKKLGKAAQNMKFTNPNMTGTGIMGQYKIKTPPVVSDVEIQPSVRPVVKTPETEDFIIDAIKIVKALGFEKSRLLLDRANKILQEI